MFIISILIHRCSLILHLALSEYMYFAETKENLIILTHITI